MKVKSVTVLELVGGWGLVGSGQSLLLKGVVLVPVHQSVFCPHDFEVKLEAAKVPFYNKMKSFNLCSLN